MRVSPPRTSSARRDLHSRHSGAAPSNYQFALTEPYLFDRPITAGIDVYSRKIDYLTSATTVGYSEVRTGASVTGGRPLGRFTRLFSSYTYEVIDTAVADSLLEGTTTTGATVSRRLHPSSRTGGAESRVSPSPGLKHGSTTT